MNPRFWIAVYHGNTPDPRWSAAKGQKTPFEVLRFIATDPASTEAHVHAVADNKTTSASIIQWIYQHRDRWGPEETWHRYRVLEAVASNPNTPGDVLRALTTSDSQEVRLNAFANLEEEVYKEVIAVLGASVLGVRLKTLTDEPTSQYAKKTQERYGALLKKIERETDELLNYMANEDAAMSYSQGSDDDEGKDVWMKAVYGDLVGVDGEVSEEDVDPPEDYVKLSSGGVDPTGQEVEIQTEGLIDSVVSRSRLKKEKSEELQQLVEAVLARMGIPIEHGYMYWNSDSGSTEEWAPPKKILRVSEGEGEDVWTITRETVHPEDDHDIISSKKLETYRGTHKEAMARAKHLAEEEGEDEKVVSWAY